MSANTNFHFNWLQIQNIYELKLQQGREYETSTNETYKKLSKMLSEIINSNTSKIANNSSLDQEEGDVYRLVTQVIAILIGSMKGKSFTWNTCPSIRKIIHWRQNISKYLVPLALIQRFELQQKYFEQNYEWSDFCIALITRSRP